MHSCLKVLRLLAMIRAIYMYEKIGKCWNRYEDQHLSYYNDFRKKTRRARALACSLYILFRSDLYVEYKTNTYTICLKRFK